MKEKTKTKTKTIKKILVANRSEIALRVFATCTDMGIKTVSIYSVEDQALPHVGAATESYSLGQGTLRETYLNHQKILDIALKAKVDAIHPGYGLLSENAEFCKKVEDAGIIFIGPAAKVMALMGDKMTAKLKMEEWGIPLLPGYHGEQQDVAFLKVQAVQVGFPVLIKAAAGGGGKGMRIVEDEQGFESALGMAKSECLKAFGDDRVLIEKFIRKPRHIEVQVFSDGHGNHLHLFERECSIQRRNQKIIEESPSPAAFLTPEKRQELFTVSTKITRQANYLGAGTIEYLFDEVGNFYFLEMNTRLQVEHPVTEMTTGIDLVRWQIEAAEGKKIAVTQSEIVQKGHAVEVRLYAEDPYGGHLPTVGTILEIGRKVMSQARLEVGLQEGNAIDLLFDPMCAKLVTWGETRQQAIDKMVAFLDQIIFAGLQTNRDYLKSIFAIGEFRSGNISTLFLKEHEAELEERRLSPENENSQEVALIAASLAAQIFATSPVGKNKKKTSGLPTGSDEASGSVRDDQLWNQLQHFRIL